MASKTNVSDYRFSIFINNDQAKKSLIEMENVMKGYQTDLQNLEKENKKDSDEYRTKSQALKDCLLKMQDLRKEAGLQSLSIKELRNLQNQLNNELARAIPGSENYKKLSNEIAAVNARMTELKVNSRGMATVLTQQSGLLKDGLSHIGTWIMELGAGMATMFALSSIKNWVKEGVEAAMKLKDTESLLLVELDGNKKVQKELISLAKERAWVTKDRRIEIEEAEKFLAIQMRTPEQIKKTILAAQDLAVMTGHTLQESVEELDKTMEGRLSKSLQGLDKDFKDLSKTQMYHGDAIDLVAKKYSGLAEREMYTFDGILNLLGKSWNRLQRTIGEGIIGSGNVFGGLIKDATSLLNTFTRWFEIPLSKKLEEESMKVNLLASRIMEANTSAADRNKLYNELKLLAPDVTAGLNAEALSYTQLTRNLEKYNMMMINKVLIQKHQEDIDKSNQGVADIRDKRIAQEQELREAMIKSANYMAGYDAHLAAKMKVIMMDSTKSLLEKVEAYNKIGGGANLQGKVNVLEMYYAEEARALEKTNQLLKNKKDIMDSLGIKDESSLSVGSSASDPRIKNEKEVVEFVKKSEAELNEIISRGREADATNADRTAMRMAQQELNRREGLAKAYTQYMHLMEEIASMEHTDYAAKLSQTAGEIRAVNEKYNNEIKKIKEYRDYNEKTLSPTQKKDLTDRSAELAVIRDQQTKQILLTAEKDFSDQVSKLHENMEVARMSITARQIYETKKKYKDAQKEILESIEYRYQQELQMAGSDGEKIEKAQKDKAASLAKIHKDLLWLKKQMNEEVEAAQIEGDQKFQEDLQSLRLKGEKDIAKGKEKIQLEVNAKYRKILKENADDEVKTAEIKAQMEQEITDKQVEYEIDARKKMIDKIVHFAKEIAGIISGLASSWSNYQNALVQRDENANNKQKENLKKRLDSGQISQKTYDEKTARMDEDLNKKKRKAAHDTAVANKAIGVVNAIVNTAVAVTSALTAGPIIGEVLAALVLLAGLAEIAVITGTPVPEASEGRYNVIGASDGKKYNNVPYEKSPVSGVYATPTIISETGQEIIINPADTRELQMNYPDVIDAIKYVHTGQRASGSYVQAVSTPTISSSSYSSSGSSDKDSKLLDALEKFNAHADKGLTAMISYDYYTLEMAKLASIRNDVKKSN